MAQWPARRSKRLLAPADAARRSARLDIDALADRLRAQRAALAAARGGHGRRLADPALPVELLFKRARESDGPAAVALEQGACAAIELARKSPRGRRSCRAERGRAEAETRVAGLVADWPAAIARDRPRRPRLLFPSAGQGGARRPVGTRRCAPQFDFKNEQHCIGAMPRRTSTLSRRRGAGAGRDAAASDLRARCYCPALAALSERLTQSRQRQGKARRAERSRAKAANALRAKLAQKAAAAGLSCSKARAAIWGSALPDAPLADAFDRLLLRLAPRASGGWPTNCLRSRRERRRAC